MKLIQQHKILSIIQKKLNFKKLNIELIELGRLPFQINFEKFKRHTKSELFEITTIRYEQIPKQASSKSKHNTDVAKKYSLENDKIIDKIVKSKNDIYGTDHTIYFFISYIHMADGWYCRRVGNTNCIAFSFADIYDKLAAYNIPPENLIKSTLTAYSMWCFFDKELPTEEQEREYMHRDTRGCIMDFCENNIDAIFSADKPYLCSECINQLKEKLEQKQLTKYEAEIVSKFYGNKINKELKKIKKNWLIRLKEFVQKHIVLSLSFSFIFPFTMSVLANIRYCSFSWKEHGLAIISSSLLILWLTFLSLLIWWDNKKFLNFRNPNYRNFKYTKRS